MAKDKTKKDNRNQQPPDSAKVGSAGSSRERSALVMASARSLPCRANGIVPGMFSIMNEICPPMRSFKAGAPPL